MDGSEGEDTDGRKGDWTGELREGEDFPKRPVVAGKKVRNKPTKKKRKRKEKEKKKE